MLLPQGASARVAEHNILVVLIGDKQNIEHFILRWEDAH